MIKTGFEEWGTNIGICYINGVYANQRFEKVTDTSIKVGRNDVRHIDYLKDLLIVGEDDKFVYVNNPVIEEHVEWFVNYCREQIK